MGTAQTHDHNEMPSTTLSTLIHKVLDAMPAGIKSVVLWENHVVTGALVGTVTLLFLLTELFGYTMLELTGLVAALLLLGLLGLKKSVYVIAMVQSKPVEEGSMDLVSDLPKLDKESTKALVDSSVDHINVVIGHTSSILACENALHVLTAAGAFYGLSVIGSIFSVPYGYTQQREKFDAIIDQIETVLTTSLTTAYEAVPKASHLNKPKKA